MSTKNEVSWADMVIPEPKRVADFYAAVMDYDLKPYDEGEGKVSYALTNSESKEVFGVCDARSFPNWTGGWVLYITVDDLEDRVARIEENGGEIIGYWPREEGRRGECLFRDPSGAGVMLQEAKGKAV